MTSLTLSAGGIKAALSTHGGLVTRLRWQNGSESVPLFRDAPAEADPLRAACYPLVPFGNRVRGNRFSLRDRTYELKANTDWDPHYLHGEGWLSDWTVTRSDEASMEMGFAFAGDDGSPYAYEARQGFAIADGAFRMTLSVTHRGEAPLPYGLGWHPYFPMTPLTTLEAPAERFWTEAEGWLPGEATAIPDDLDFSKPHALPERWVNNGFENWSGRAEIRWPERGAKLSLLADEPFRHAFVFVSDRNFDPTFRRDYFCFEPMTHLANGHNMADLGGLSLLEPGETLSGGVTLRPARLA